MFIIFPTYTVLTIPKITIPSLKPPVIDTKLNQTFGIFSDAEYSRPTTVFFKDEPIYLRVDLGKQYDGLLIVIKLVDNNHNTVIDPDFSFDGRYITSKIAAPSPGIYYFVVSARKDGLSFTGEKNITVKGENNQSPAPVKIEVKTIAISKASDQTVNELKKTYENVVLSLPESIKQFITGIYRKILGFI